MGKSSKPTIGFWYRVAYHAGLGIGPMDAFLEFRAGDKTAWTGELTASGTISINAPHLFGGEKDQGGIVGDVDVMFGEAAQVPNTYLLSKFGSQVPAWRGMATLAFKGGRYGAMNPYPQKPAYKFRKVKAGWDDTVWGTSCWYPEKAEVQVAAATTLPSDAGGWDYQVLADETDPGFRNLGIPASGWAVDGQGPFGSGPTTTPFNTSWPGHTILWIRRTVTVTGANQMLRVSAENGCVVFVNGAIAGEVNRINEQITHNETNVFEFYLSAGRTYEIAVKAFDEAEILANNATFLSIEITAPGLTAMNPAHILYYARTHGALGREPVANINDASFRTGADWFHAAGVGLCTDYDPTAESVDDFIARVSRVAGCGIERSPVDGQWYLDIINGQYDLASLPILTDDDILSFSESPSVMDSAANSISVKYFDPQTKEDVTTAPVQALALVDAFGTIHQTINYPESPTGDLSLRLAERDLRNGVTPTRAFELTCTRKPYSWRRCTYFRLQSPKRGIADMVCILAGSQTGTLKSGAIKITAAQDVYSLPAVSYVEVEPGVDTRPSPMPLGIVNQAAFEAPYTEVVQRLRSADMNALPGDVGYLMAVATDPSVSGGSRDFTLTVSSDGGSTYAATADGAFCPSALVVEGDALAGGEPPTSFTLTGGTGLDDVAVGSPAMWDGEWCRVDAIDPTAGTVTLARGCADTLPQPHAANARVWFCDSAVAADPTQYTTGETVQAKLLTNTGAQQLDPALASALDVTFSQRMALPYPPGNLAIGGVRYPTTGSGNLVLTWATRNRVVQADQLLDTTAASVTPEADVRTALQVFDASDTLLVEKLDIAGTTATVALVASGTVRIKLYTINDAGDSLHAYDLSLSYTTGGAGADTITASTWTAPETIIDGGGA